MSNTHKKWKRIAIVGSLIAGVGMSAVYQLRSDPDFYDATYQKIKPLVFRLTKDDAESAHKWAVALAQSGIVPIEKETDPPILRWCDGWKVRIIKRSTHTFPNQQVFGKAFPNPIGVAAGFDKHAEAIPGMLYTGFGFVEIGSVTPQPQAGNSRPRVFRLPEDRAVINRYGFNSEGVAAVRQRLAAYRHGDIRPFFDRILSLFGAPAAKNVSEGIVGVNLGKNKTSPEGPEDFVVGIRSLSEFADYVVVNVSSPNTPGLRSMQRRDQLGSLIRAVIQERNSLNAKHKKVVPVLVKIAPDLNDEELRDIAEVVMANNVDGVIISNTTVGLRSTLKNAQFANETGGLSGVPLFEKSTKVLSDFYSLTNGTVPLIGVGGVTSGRDAYEKIKAGASLVQLYTGLTYEGFGVARKIKKELSELLRADGYSSVSQAVGISHRKKFASTVQRTNRKETAEEHGRSQRRSTSILDVLFN